MYTINDFKQTKIIIDFRDEENPEKLRAILKKAYPKRKLPDSVFQAWFWFGDQWGWGCCSGFENRRYLRQIPLVTVNEIQL